VPAVPAGLRLRPDAGARLAASGSVAGGGSPVLVLRLTLAGQRKVAGWFSGAPVPPSAAARTLAPPARRGDRSSGLACFPGAGSAPARAT